MSGLFEFGKRALREFKADDISGLAAELSYRYFLALFPFFIFLAALGGFIASLFGISDPTGRLMNAFGDALPADARSVLQGQVRSVVGSKSVGLLSFGIIGAFWAASGAMSALTRALNRTYDVPETRPFWKTTGIALLMTLAATIGIIGSVVLLVGTSAWGSEIAGWFGAGHAFELTVTVLRWPVIIALVLFAVAVMYWAAPNYDLPFRYITPGAVLFVVVWVAATGAFGVYAANFSSYNKTYGTLGGVVVLLTWLYITNAVLLLGAEINALLEHDSEPAPAEHQRQQLAQDATPAQQKQSMELAPSSATVGTRSAPSTQRSALVRAGILGASFAAAAVALRHRPDRGH